MSEKRSGGLNNNDSIVIEFPAVRGNTYVKDIFSILSFAIAEHKLNTNST